MAAEVTTTDPLTGTVISTVSWGHLVYSDFQTLDKRKCVARGRRTTNSSTTTTEVGVLRIDSITVTSGRLYGIFTSALILASTIANDTLRAIIRGDTSTTATTSSTQLDMGQLQQPNTSAPPGSMIVALYPAAATATLSVLLSVARQTGTGNVQILGASTFPIDMWVVDLGPDPGNTGVSI